MASWFEKIAALPRALQGWLSGSNSVNMLVTGKTGVGKSSLINGVVGKEVAEEGDTLDRGKVTVQAFASSSITRSTSQSGTPLGFRMVWIKRKSTLETCSAKVVPV